MVQLTNLCITCIALQHTVYKQVNTHAAFYSLSPICIKIVQIVIFEQCKHDDHDKQIKDVQQAKLSPKHDIIPIMNIHEKNNF